MIVVVVDDLSRRLVPDELWALAQPLIPGFDPRPQGEGITAPIRWSSRRGLRPCGSARRWSWAASLLDIVDLLAQVAAMADHRRIHVGGAVPCCF
jgi:hypothetical protein